MASQNEPSADAQADNAFPAQQYPASDAGNAPSIISSRMTDIASEDGDDIRHPLSAQETSSNVQRRSMSRPGTSTTVVSSRNPWSPGSAARRPIAPGAPGKRSSMTNSTAGSAGGRPPSRTHVPSLTSHAFFKPMSSQRLQAQRGLGRPLTTGNAGPAEAVDAQGDGDGQRHSLGSDAVGKAGLSLHRDYEPSPPSRGTETTHREMADRMTANASPTDGQYTAGSFTDSVRPLQNDGANRKGLAVNVDKGYKNNPSTPTRSSRSFRQSFLRPDRGDAAPVSPNRSSHGREKLSSAASSHDIRPDLSKKEPMGQKAGNNYQYFTGNTVFCWGGRLQNSRQRPLNIATGLTVVIPGILFFVFSAPWYWHNISPAVPIMFAYVFFVTLSSFIHASVSDPGVSHIEFPLRLAKIDKSRFSLEISTKCRPPMRMKIH